MPIIDRIVAGYRYTRPRALDALVVLVNEFLIPHFDAQSNFAKTPHNGRIIWLQNLIKTRHGENLIQQATQKLGETLLKELEEQRKNSVNSVPSRHSNGRMPTKISDTMTTP